MSIITKDEKFKIEYSSGLARSIIATTHSLSTNKLVFSKSTNDIFKIISKRLEGYNEDSFASESLSTLSSPLKFTYLSYLYQESKDVKGLKEIGEKFNTLVMNDKEKLNYHNFGFFYPYLSSLDETLYKEVIHPEIDFMMKRGLTMLPLISQTVAALTFKFGLDTINALSAGLFTDEYLVKEEFTSDIKNYFNTLGGKIDSKEGAVALVIDFLFKKYQAAKTSSSINVA